MRPSITMRGRRQHTHRLAVVLAAVIALLGMAMTSASAESPYRWAGPTPRERLSCSAGDAVPSRLHSS